MNGFIFTQQFNSVDSPLMRSLGNRIRCVADGPARGATPTHTCDATGSFHTLAGTLRRRLDIRNPTCIYDNRQSAREMTVFICDALAAAPAPLDFVAYLGHGTPSFVRYPGGVRWGGRGDPVTFWSEERLSSRDEPFENDMVRILSDNGLL